MLNFVIKYRYQNGCSFVNNRSFAHHRSDNRNTDYRWNRISVRRRVVRAETRIMETSILITSVNGIKWKSYDIIDHPWIMLDLIFQWTSKSSRIITIRGDWTFFKYRFAILRSKFLENEELLEKVWKKLYRAAKYLDPFGEVVSTLGERNSSLSMRKWQRVARVHRLER